MLGCTVKLDDLTPRRRHRSEDRRVVHWHRRHHVQALAHTDVVALQSMLDAAGSRYKMHDPSSWPRQAAFLAAGDWEGFRRFHDERTARS